MKHFWDLPEICGFLLEMKWQCILSVKELLWGHLWFVSRLNNNSNANARNNLDNNNNRLVGIVKLNMLGYFLFFRNI